MDDKMHKWQDKLEVLKLTEASNEGAGHWPRLSVVTKPMVIDRLSTDVYDNSGMRARSLLSTWAGYQNGFSFESNLNLTIRGVSIQYAAVYAGIDLILISQRSDKYSAPTPCMSGK